MFKKILIANRGEIALRIIRTCKELGIKTVSIYSTADTDAMHVRMADESVCIGPPKSLESYLSISSIIAACEVTGADAVHPGYGFLSESYQFAQVVSDHKLKFIGPSAEHIKMMGDKITAKDTMKELGVPCVPGSDGSIENVSDAKKIAKKIGYPILIKATSGGGGRGMKVAKSEDDIENAFLSAKNEARNSFGNDEVYLEKFLLKPRHIEIQIIGDGNGNAIHFGERDCSLQRRHQKILEECPSPIIKEHIRESIGNICTKAISKINYSGVGTIEFLYENEKFYFIEMNTRLQVEHPVTECVYNIDLVKEQINIASGKKISISQKDIKINGHAIECRINAESIPDFIPSPGEITDYHAPGGYGVRMDSAIYRGYSIPPFYDSLIGKLVIYGNTREETLRRLKRALSELIIDGVNTTSELFLKLLDDDNFLRGDYTIYWLEDWLKRKK